MSETIILQFSSDDLLRLGALIIGVSTVLVLDAIYQAAVCRRAGKATARMWSGSIVAVLGACTIVVSALMQAR